MIPPVSRKAGAVQRTTTAKPPPPPPKTAKEMKAQKKADAKAAKDMKTQQKADAKKEMPASSTVPKTTKSTANSGVTLGERKKKPTMNPFKILMGRD